MVIIPGAPPWSLFPLGPDPDAYSGYWDEWIDTAKGRVFLHSIGSGTWSTGLQAGLSTIVPEYSTGAFAGARGIFSTVPDWQTYEPESPELFSGVSRFSGYLCRP